MFELWITNVAGRSYQELYRRTEGKELAERIGELLVSGEIVKFEVVFPGDL